MNITGLGTVQRDLLLGIYERHIEYAQHHFLSWRTGVDWRSPHGATRAQHAAHSRALARLEAAGLITRMGGRHVRLEPAGVEFVEKWLTKKRGVWMLTVGTLEVPPPMTAEEFRAEMQRIIDARSIPREPACGTTSADIPDIEKGVATVDTLGE